MLVGNSTHSNPHGKTAAAFCHSTEIEQENHMKVAGIIAEYNPFHNGHQYHIEKTREITKADYIIGIMSGDFVQRGAPAFLDKYQRTYSALQNGCDLVLELPVFYSTSSAEFFAFGAVSLLEHLGVCDFLSFGSENGLLDELRTISHLLVAEPKEYQEALRAELKLGHSYPKARENALSTYARSASNCQFHNDILAELNKPNNILALEYLKSLEKQSGKMVPVTVSRKNTSYHDKKIYADISSATAIRHWIRTKEDLTPLSGTVPAETFASLEENRKNNSLVFSDQLTPYLHEKLVFHPTDCQIVDLDTELSKRLSKLSWATLTFSEIAARLKSRKFTASRISRGLLHLILSMEQEAFSHQYEENPAPYVKILGFRKEASPLLKAIKKNAALPVVTKPARAKKLLPSSASWAWEMDVRARNLYQSLVFQKSGICLPGPFSQSPIVLDREKET
jgi:predicted nucleotidyltransferase